LQPLLVAQASRLCLQTGRPLAAIIRRAWRALWNELGRVRPAHLHPGEGSQSFLLFWNFLLDCFIRGEMRQPPAVSPDKRESRLLFRNGGASRANFLGNKSGWRSTAPGRPAAPLRDMFRNVGRLLARPEGRRSHLWQNKWFKLSLICLNSPR